MSQTDPTVTTENEGLWDTDSEPIFQEQIREEGGTGKVILSAWGVSLNMLLLEG